MWGMGIRWSLVPKNTEGPGDSFYHSAWGTPGSPVNPRLIGGANEPNPEPEIGDKLTIQIEIRGLNGGQHRTTFFVNDNQFDTSSGGPIWRQFGFGITQPSPLFYGITPGQYQPPLGTDPFTDPFGGDPFAWTSISYFTSLTASTTASISFANYHPDYWNDPAIDLNPALVAPGGGWLFKIGVPVKIHLQSRGVALPISVSAIELPPGLSVDSFGTIFGTPSTLGNGIAKLNVNGLQQDYPWTVG